MGTNPSSPAYCRQETFIEASPKEVFDVIAQLNQWPEWQSGVKMIHADHPLECGATFKWNNSGMQINSRVTRIEEGKMICWTSKAIWIKARISWVLEEEDHGCHVYYEQIIEGLGAELMKKPLVNSMKTTLLELRKFFESEHLLPDHSKW